MVNFLRQLENPQIKAHKFFEVMRDFRKGGLNPENYEEFLQEVHNLPSIINRTTKDYEVFEKFKLSDISEFEFNVILREVQRRGIDSSKKCWHPQAGPTTCKLDKTGKILVSAAHSIQNNGVLSKVAEDGHVMGYALDKGEFDGTHVGKNLASIFWGFCNTHDAIFNPIETSAYIGSDEQHFLFAYRGFVVAAHKKIEVSNWLDFGDQSANDIAEDKRIFDDAINSKTFDILETEVFELPAFYPIAVSSSFYLDFDFEGNPIPHSETRMENIFVTLLPLENKTLFLLSYLKQDQNLYGNLGSQLRARNNLKSDITMLIAAHVENVYFNPTYYRTFIEKHEKALEEIFIQSQMDHATIGENDELQINFSFTPSDYLNNQFEVNFFGY